MPEFESWPAPAKLNLFLSITGRRADGYHELQTVFQLLDWGDEISIAPTQDGSIIREAGMEGVAPEDDLAVRAARLLQQASGTACGARLRVVKSIPAGAGLGGGSSDAATVLMALNRQWACGLSTPELAELGQRLGADVPVFVYGHSAWAEGMGERLTPMRLGARHYVLVFPGLHISTAELFADPELFRNATRLRPGAPGWERAGNVFMAVALARHPGLRAIVEDLRKEGEPRMTGTGSCLFLEFADKSTAQTVTSRLNSRYNARAVRGIDRSPVLDLCKARAG